MINRHPVDELSDVRAQVAALKVREDELRDLILAGGCSTVGEEFRAEIRNASSERIDTKAMRKALGTEFLKPWLKPSKNKQVWLRAVGA